MFFSRKSKEQKFWKWFEANQERFLTLNFDSPNLNDIVREVGTRINKVDKALDFEFSLESSEDGKREFIISAGGVSEVIPAVESLHATAPELSQWHLVKFKQRKPFTKLTVGPFVFGPENIWFSCSKGESEKLDIILYFENFKEELMRLYMQVGFIVLDAGLGEYDVMMRVGEIDWKSNEVMPEDHHPLSQLEVVFDRLK